ncbi:hypothetical protein [Lacisediminimonas profundi]|uniref:hypothetical protein n=1 Tax=Lacisediminimonas profundi TaxID=2603856 RepID=UPI00124B60CD|nr:hypothetical protein [Lacisediminimonas profundi]
MSHVTANEELQELFRTEKLPLPPLPEELTQALVKTGPHSWSTRAGASRPDDLDSRVAEARSGIGDYAEIGFAGHGINSWFMYCNVVHGPLALFLQCRWNNAYDDEQRARTRIEGVSGFAARLLAEAPQAAQLGALAPGERLIVCFGDHFPSRWQWSSEPGHWNQDGDFTLLAATAALRARIAAAKGRS